MKSSGRRRFMSVLAALMLLVTAGMSGCSPAENPPDDSSVVTDYPPVSTQTTPSSDGTTSDSTSFATSTSAEVDDDRPGQQPGSHRETVTRVVSSVTVVPGTPGTSDVYDYKYALLPGDFCVIKNGKVQATIVIADDAGANVVAAANDLAANLQKMTGQTFAIKSDKETVEGNKILIGKSKYTDAVGVTFPSQYPGEEMFRVISSANILILGGNDAGIYKGSQFAVTYFLESLGFGWFGSDELWTVVPSGNTIYATECDITSKASFSSRYTRLSAAEPQLTNRWFVGGELTQTDHSLPSLVPESLYAEHPEYFAYSQGTRDPAGKRWVQRCLSNPDVQNLVAEKIIEFFKTNPNYTVASIGQQDGNGDPNSPDYANWCECDDCKKFAPDFTQTMIKFANIIGQKIREACPGKGIMFYGYFPTFIAPDADLQVEDNVVLMLCKEGGLTRFIRNGNLFNADIGQPQFKDNFQKWKELGYRMAIYEWNCPGAASDKWKDMFWVQGEVFLDNLKWFKENGVEYLCVDQGPNPAYERADSAMDIRWPLWYVSAKGMWDCNLSFEQILMPACKKLFGPAAQDMYDFYKALNDANKNCSAPNYYWAIPEPEQFYTAEWIEKADAAMTKALEKAEAAGGVILERVLNQDQNWETTKSYT